jgi:hypothetical protein
MRINLSCKMVQDAFSGSHNTCAVLWWFPGRPCITRWNKLSGGDLFIPVKFAFLLVDLSELHRTALMGAFKHAVKIGHVIKAGQKRNPADLFIRFNEQLTRMFETHSDQVV